MQRKIIKTEILCLKLVVFTELSSACIDNNPPHVHFTYGNYECSISVLDRVVDGQAPAKVISKVNQWIDLHEQEILTLWEKAQEGKQIGRIEPLK